MSEDADTSDAVGWEAEAVEDDRLRLIHVTLVDRDDWLLSMIPAFLDAPMPEAR
jgi:hypothetical protein